ncbi:LysR family transcriptional regulator [Rhizobium leguminosarum]|uniref:LysR family transcriptional regulator n=1 Tax=Rhizobium leguminosarum TaxID=384 RepID=UPI001C8FEEBA|nr:LysR family transcriptional regulator [Rhizobium leguminosarum]MBY2907702.1 LysR family transcriptional regulator [Rhizobium leguminosarum]
MADWENLRHFLAVARSGTLSGAARTLKVDHATVSRRLAALEVELDVALIDRLPRSCRLTAIGQQVCDQVITMESASDGIARIARAAHTPLIGKVTLSASPVLAAHLLAQHLAHFRSLYPDICLSLASQAQQVSLSRREADVALRMVRPKETGNFTRKLGVMTFGLYGRRDYAHRDVPDRWQFIAYDESLADMPQQKWLLGIAGTRPIACELNDISGRLTAARAGAGVAGLPCFLGDADPGLTRIGENVASFSRDIWLVVHRDLRKTPSVRAVIDFVFALITQHGGFSK